MLYYLKMLFFLALVTLSSVQASPADKRLASTDSDFQTTMQVSGAIAGMVPLILMHLSIRTSGFKLTRSFGGTDLAMWLLLGFSAAIWSTIVFLSAFLYQDMPCRPYNKWACLSRLAYVPWILIAMFCIWVGAVVNHLFTLMRYSDKGFEGQEEATFGGTFEESWRIGFWGPMMSKVRLLGVGGTLAFAPIVLATSIGAFKDGQYTISVLNIVGGIIFLLFSLYRTDVYRGSPHKYAADNIRIPPATELDPSLVYILPSLKHDFDAIYSRRIESEHAARDKAKDLELYYSGPKKWKKWERQEVEDEKEKKEEKKKEKEKKEKEAYAMRSLIADHSKNITPLTFKEVECLAEWLCGERSGLSKNFIRSPHVSLIGRELMMALLHCEKLVFRMKRKLEPEMRNKISELRPMERKSEDASGSPDMSGSEEEPKKSKQCARATVTTATSISSAGSRNDEKERGHANESPTEAWNRFCKAAKRVYEIFGEPLNEEADLTFGDRNRVGQLWDDCFDVDQSTFGALYLWSSAWYMENGNGNGYDVEPLMPNPKDHYMASRSDWLINWRDIWFVAVFSQLLSMLPTVLNSFLGSAIA